MPRRRIVSGEGVFLGVLLFCGGVLSSENDHTYSTGDPVHVYGNKIGPFNNPLETYGYFDVLPWCSPESTIAKRPTLGEALAGDELIRLALDIRFGRAGKSEIICTRKVTAKEAGILVSAVKQQYWYQLYIDELPVWAALGKIKKEVPYIYTHQRFSLGYNGDKVVVANLTAEDKVEIPLEGGELKFTYSVDWAPSTVQFEGRFRRYLDESFFEHRIHWVSVLNSFMMVFVLACIVLMVLLRTLRADWARYNMDVEDDAELRDESGWKQVHGDVFRVPPHHVFLCALVGTGCQLIVFCFCLIFIAIVSVIYADRGGLLTYGVLSYLVTSCVAGYASGRLFTRYTAAGPAISKEWKTTMFYTSALFPGCVSVVIFVLNGIAVAYSSQQAIPFFTMAAMFLMWLCVSLPLVLLGTFIGRHQKRASNPRYGFELNA